MAAQGSGASRRSEATDDGGWARTDSRSSNRLRCGRARAVSNQKAVLELLRVGAGEPLVVRLGQGLIDGPVASTPSRSDAWTQSQPQSDAQERLQGCRP